MENMSDTPDFILATYLSKCLEAFDEAVRVRDNHYRFRPWEQKSEAED